MSSLLKISLGALAVGLLLAPMVWAADATTTPPTTPPPTLVTPPTTTPPPPMTSAGQAGQRHWAVEMIRDILGQLDLTSAQKPQVEALLTKFHDQIKAAVEKNGDQIKALHEQIKEAEAAKDQAKVKELRQQLHQLLPGVVADLTELRDQLKPILTDAQNQKLDSLIAEARLHHRQFHPGALVEAAIRNADKLGLTDAQKTTIQTALKAFHDALAAAAPGDKTKVFRQAGETLLGVLKTTLGPDKLAQLRGMLDERLEGPGARIAEAVKSLNLTDDQKKQVQQLVQAFREVFKAAAPADRRGLVQKLRTDILAVLTPEQKAKAQELLKEERGGNGVGKANPLLPPANPAPVGAKPSTTP